MVDPAWLDFVCSAAAQYEAKEDPGLHYRFDSWVRHLAAASERLSFPWWGEVNPGFGDYGTNGD